MNWLKWMESRIKNFTIIDFGFLKICLIAFALMVAKLWPGILALNWYWYGLIFLITYLWLLFRIFGKQQA